MSCQLNENIIGLTELQTGSTDDNDNPVSTVCDDVLANATDLSTCPEPAKLSLADAKLRATAKLQDALKAKRKFLLNKRAELQRARIKSAQKLTPINALLKGGNESLLIRNIGHFGIEDKTHFVTPLSLYNSCRSSNAEKLASNGDEQRSNENYTEKGKHATLSRNLLENISLLKRKQTVESLLLEAKEKRQKFEASQVAQNGVSNMPMNEQPSILSSKPKLNRNDLIKRRKIAERKKAITHFRHVVAKQENLQRLQDQRFEQLTSDLEKTEKAVVDIQHQLRQTEKNVQSLDLRGDVLADMIVDYVNLLIDARKKLHDYKQAVESL